MKLHFFYMWKLIVNFLWFVKFRFLYVLKFVNLNYYLFDFELLQKHLLIKKYNKNLQDSSILLYWFGHLNSNFLRNEAIVKSALFPYIWVIEDSLRDNESFSKSIEAIEEADKLYAFLQKIDFSLGYENILQKMKEIQLQSILQKTDKLEIEQLKRITFDKGGYSFLFFSLILEYKLNENEQKLVYSFGAISQLMDDLLDYYEDKMDGVETLANKLGFEELELLYQDLQSDFLKKAYKVNQSYDFQLFNKLITSIGMMQIENLKNNKKQKVEFCEANRSKYILDMEKISNLYQVYKMMGEV